MDIRRRAAFMGQSGARFTGQAISGADENGTLNISLSGLSISAGMIGVLWLGVHNGGDGTGSVVGFDELFNNVASGDAVHIVATKEMDGTETAITTTGGTGWDSTSYVFALFSGCLKPTTSEISTATGSPSTSPDPPAETFTGGDMAICAAVGRFSWTPVTNPTGYTTLKHQLSDQRSLAVAYKYLPDASENPGTFSPNSGVALGWAASTLCLKRK